MKLLMGQDWLKNFLERHPNHDEPSGLLACSPELMKAAELKAGRPWNGSQTDAEALVYGYLSPAICAPGLVEPPNS